MLSPNTWPLWSSTPDAFAERHRHAGYWRTRAQKFAGSSCTTFAKQDHSGTHATAAPRRITPACEHRARRGLHRSRAPRRGSHNDADIRASTQIAAAPAPHRTAPAAAFSLLATGTARVGADGEALAAPVLFAMPAAFDTLDGPAPPGLLGKAPPGPGFAISRSDLPWARRLGNPVTAVPGGAPPASSALTTSLCVASNGGVQVVRVSSAWGLGASTATSVGATEKSRSTLYPQVHPVVSVM